MVIQGETVSNTVLKSSKLTQKQTNYRKNIVSTERLSIVQDSKYRIALPNKGTVSPKFTINFLNL